MSVVVDAMKQVGGALLIFLLLSLLLLREAQGFAELWNKTHNGRRKGKLEHRLPVT